MRGVRCKLSLADAYLRLVPCVLAWAPRDPKRRKAAGRHRLGATHARMKPVLWLCLLLCAAVQAPLPCSQNASGACEEPDTIAEDAGRSQVQPTLASERRGGPPRSSPPPVPPLTPVPDWSSQFVVPAHVPLALVPPVLEFEPWPLCVPSVTNVEMINTSEDEDVDVHSVSQMSEIFTALTRHGCCPAAASTSPWSSCCASSGASRALCSSRRAPAASSTR